MSGVTVIPDAQMLKVCASSRFVIDTYGDYARRLLKSLEPFRSAICSLVFLPKSTKMLDGDSRRMWVDNRPDPELNVSWEFWRSLLTRPNIEEVGFVLPISRTEQTLMGYITRPVCHILDTGGLQRLLFLSEDVLPELPQGCYKKPKPTTEQHTRDRFIITRILLVPGRSVRGMSWPVVGVNNAGKCVFIFERISGCSAQRAYFSRSCSR